MHLCRAPLAAFACALTLGLALARPAAAQQAPRHVTSPAEQFGFPIGADYHLVDYAQLEAYWQKLARESDRMVLREMGRTAEGRTQWVAILSAPQNLKDLERYRQIAQRLALAKGLTDEEAKQLASEGKAVV